MPKETIEFVGKDGGTVTLQKIVLGPGYYFEDSKWVASGNLEAEYTSLKTAYARLHAVGYVRK